jgi:hypothetical protein
MNNFYFMHQENNSRSSVYPSADQILIHPTTKQISFMHQENYNRLSVYSSASNKRVHVLTWIHIPSQSKHNARRAVLIALRQLFYPTLTPNTLFHASQINS